MRRSGNKKVGLLNKKVIELLELNDFEECPIYMGDDNIEHMKETHDEDYHKYGRYIKRILKNPAYLSKHPKDSSIHYIKVIKSKYVKVVVRQTSNSILFVRTIFTISEENIRKYKRRNALKTY